MTRRPLLYRFAQWSARNALEMFYRLEVVGLENLPMQGPLLIAGNHTSYMDPPAIGCILPRATWFFARKTLFKGPVSTFFLRNFLTIPVDRDGDSDISAMKRVVQLLKAENAIVLFPEGTRSPDGKPQPIRPGIGWLACKGGANILPTRVEGTFKAWSRNQKSPTTGNTIRVSFGPPITPEDYDPGASAGKARFQMATEQIEKNLRMYWTQSSR